MKCTSGRDFIQPGNRAQDFFISSFKEQRGGHDPLFFVFTIALMRDSWGAPGSDLRSGSCGTVKSTVGATDFEGQKVERG